MTLAPDSVLGPYVVESLLGSGGMGSVYRATDTRLRRPVALKVMLPGRGGSAVHSRRFEEEARSASALNHPNIVTIYDVGTSSDITYIAMELVAGQSLRQLLANGKPLPLAQTIDILRQLSSALATAHAAGIVHRDLKPENIVVTPAGLVKILDFGLAKRIASLPGAGADDPTLEVLTQPGMILGTPAYMAPEQARGQEADARADQFALGVIAYEMLAGANPFRRSSLSDMLVAILRDDPPPLPRTVPEPLQRVVRKLLAKEPAERYASLDELPRDLETSAPRITIGRRAIAASVAILVALLLAGGFWMRERKSAAYEPSSAAREAYLRARYFTQRDLNHDDRAIRGYEEAVRLDPKFAVGWAALARAYTARFFTQNDAPDWEQKAFVAIEKALALDPNLAEAYLARGDLLWTKSHGFPHADALRDFRKAIALRPDLADAHAQAARVLMHVGLFNEAARAMKTARALQPDDATFANRSAYLLFFQRRCDKALAEFRRQGGNDPAMLQTLDCIGRTDEARRLAEAFSAKSPNTLVHGVLAVLAAKRGDAAEADRFIAIAIEKGGNLGHFHHTEHLVASAHALLGRRELALEWLERAARNGFPCRGFFEPDANLASLRGEPRFRELMKELEAQERQLAAEM